MDRYWSLERLLTSLRDADYVGHTPRLVISIDHPASGPLTACADCMRTRASARAFAWPHGPKDVIEHAANRGLLLQWVMSWVPASDDEIGAIFEDDIQVSPLYFRWLVRERQVMGSVPLVVGAGISTQTLDALSGGPLEVRPRGVPFAYKLVQTWGLAPRPSAWRRFQQWLRVRLGTPFRPYVDGLRVSRWWRGFERWGKERGMWEQWMVRHTEGSRGFFMYANTALALANTWGEDGLHYTRDASWLRSNSTRDERVASLGLMPATARPGDTMPAQEQLAIYLHRTRGMWHRERAGTLPLTSTLQTFFERPPRLLDWNGGLAPQHPLVHELGAGDGATVMVVVPGIAVGATSTPTPRRRRVLCESVARLVQAAETAGVRVQVLVADPCGDWALASWCTDHLATPIHVRTLVAADSYGRCHGARLQAAEAALVHDLLGIAYNVLWVRLSESNRPTPCHMDAVASRGRADSYAKHGAIVSQLPRVVRERQPVRAALDRWRAFEFATVHPTCARNGVRDQDLLLAPGTAVSLTSEETVLHWARQLQRTCALPSDSDCSSPVQKLEELEAGAHGGAPSQGAGRYKGPQEANVLSRALQAMQAPLRPSGTVKACAVSKGSIEEMESTLTMQLAGGLVYAP